MAKVKFLVNNEKDLQEGFKLIETSECVAKIFDIRKRSISYCYKRKQQSNHFFPLQENEHRNQILFKTIVPARIDKTAEAKEQVNKIIQSIHFIGTFTVEFFYR
ncbi:ATP-grasp domain-containing protein [Staphylococcus aureus]